MAVVLESSVTKLSRSWLEQERAAAQEQVVERAVVLLGEQARRQLGVERRQRTVHAEPRIAGLNRRVVNRLGQGRRRAARCRPDRAAPWSFPGPGESLRRASAPRPAAAIVASTVSGASVDSGGRPAARLQSGIRRLGRDRAVEVLVGSSSQGGCITRQPDKKTDAASSKHQW